MTHTPSCLSLLQTISRVKAFSNLENGGITIVRNIGSHYPSKTASRPGRRTLSEGAPWETLISYLPNHNIHPYVILFSNLMHNFFIKFIVFLYMFRAILCSSSGGLNCIYTASGSWFLRWPFGAQVNLCTERSPKNSDEIRNQMLYRCN